MNEQVQQQPGFSYQYELITWIKQCRFPKTSFNIFQKIC